MGTWWEFEKPCPNCGAKLECMYGKSCNGETIKCWKCGKVYEIVMEFKLVPKDKWTTVSKTSVEVQGT